MSTGNGEIEDATALLDCDAFMQPFLNILKDSSSSSSMNLSTVRSLALKVFAHPQIFCGFDEFKSRCLSILLPGGENNFPPSSPGRSLSNTLDLFSYGTLKDYANQQEIDKEYYLPLNEAALTKLSQLSVLTCVQKACFDGETSISYDSLGELLGSAPSAPMQEDRASPSSLTSMENIREIEDILIQCLYANVLKGKLCQQTRSFSWRGEHLPVVLSRDVPIERISDLLLVLKGLGQRLEESGNDVDKAQEQVTQGLEKTARYWISVQRKKKSSLEDMHEKGSTSGTSPIEGGSSPRLFGGGMTTGSAASGSASQGVNPRRSSKRSRGGMAPSGFRM